MQLKQTMPMDNSDKEDQDNEQVMEYAEYEDSHHL